MSTTQTQPEAEAPADEAPPKGRRIWPTQVYDHHEVARLLNVSVKALWRLRTRKHHRFPKPVGTSASPRWLGQTIIAWYAAESERLNPTKVKAKAD